MNRVHDQRKNIELATPVVLQPVFMCSKGVKCIWNGSENWLLYLFKKTRCHINKMVEYLSWFPAIMFKGACQEQLYLLT